MGAQPIRPMELMDDPNITKSDFTDFIGVWENFVPKSRCEAFIKHFENVTSNASVVGGDDITLGGVMDGTNQFPQGSLGRKDESILINYSLYRSRTIYLSSIYTPNSRSISYSNRITCTHPMIYMRNFYC